MYTKTEWASMYINMCTFFEKIVRFRYIVVQNMLQRLVCANFVPFVTKTGLQRESYPKSREQSLSMVQ